MTEEQDKLKKLIEERRYAEFQAADFRRNAERWLVNAAKRERDANDYQAQIEKMIVSAIEEDPTLIV